MKNDSFINLDRNKIYRMGYIPDKSVLLEVTYQDINQTVQYYVIKVKRRKNELFLDTDWGDELLLTFDSLHDAEKTKKDIINGMVK